MKKHLLEKKELIFVAIILLIGLVPSIWLLFEDSPVWDEPFFISAGEYLLESGNWKIDAGYYQPHLSYYLNSFGLMLAGHEWNYSGNESLYLRAVGIPSITESNLAKETVLFLARAPFLLMYLVLGVLIFVAGKEFFGKNAGLAATIMFAFSPNIIAYNHLALTDFLVSVTGFAAVLAYYFYLKKKSSERILLAGVLLGLALASKIIAILLIPAILLAMLWDYLKTKKLDSRQLNIFVIAFLILWATYLFQFGTLYDYSSNLFNSKVEAKLGEGVLLEGYKNVPVPMPLFFKNIIYNANLQQAGFSGYFNGEYSKQGWLIYFPLLLLMKIEIWILLPALIGIYLLLKKEEKISWKKKMFFLLPLIFLALFCFNTVNSSFRYVLPLLPFVFVFASITVKKYPKILWAIAGLSLINMVFWFGNPIGYNNGLNVVSGKPFYEIYSDSTVDFGQDLIRLKGFMEEKGIESIKLNYFGSIDPKYYGINYEEAECGVSNGRVVLSPVRLVGVFAQSGECYANLRNVEPDERIGSLLYYDLK